MVRSPIKYTLLVERVLRPCSNCIHNRYNLNTEIIARESLQNHPSYRNKTRAVNSIQRNLIREFSEI